LVRCLLSRGKEERQWHRERCLELYTDVLLASTALTLESDSPLLNEPSSREGIAQISNVRAKAEDLRRASARAVLVLPESSIPHLHALTTHVDDLAKVSVGLMKPMSDDPKTMSGQKLTELTLAFLENARREIGSSPVKRTIWWRKLLRRRIPT
jgi:hypothetical protein